MVVYQDSDPWHKDLIWELMKLKKHNVLEHVIGDISGALERSLFAEKISARPGLLQSLDARVKVV